MLLIICPEMQYYLKILNFHYLFQFHEIIHLVKELVETIDIESDQLVLTQKWEELAIFTGLDKQLLIVKLLNFSVNQLKFWSFPADSGELKQHIFQRCGQYINLPVERMEQ